MTPSILASYLALPPDDVGRVSEHTDSSADRQTDRHCSVRVCQYLAANLMVRLVMGGPPSLPKSQPIPPHTQTHRETGRTPITPSLSLSLPLPLCASWLFLPSTDTPLLHHTSRPSPLTMTMANTHTMAAQYVTFSPPLSPRPSSLTSAVIDSQWCPAAIRSLLLGWGGGGGAVTCYAANAGLEGGFVLNTWVYDVFHRESNMVTESEGERERDTWMDGWMCVCAVLCCVDAGVANVL